MEPAERPLFSAAFSGALAVLLVVPFLITTFTSVEPFPAVLLPAGASKVRLHDGVASVSELTVSAGDADGHRFRLSAVDLLDPIPVHYLGSMVKVGFGFDQSEEREIELGSKRSTVSVPRHVPRDEARRLLAAWLAERVHAAGHTGDRLLARRDAIELEMKSGRELSRKPGIERVFPLR